MEMGIWNWFLAISPVVVLLVGILLLKWETARVGALSWILATIVAYYYFGAGAIHLTLANCKGLSLSLYVLLIIWGAIFLYCLAENAGAIKTIGSKIQNISDNKLLQCLLLSWCFTSLLQGLAGFGVPVAVVAPIMVAMGFDPLVAVSMCLVGHSWSISFGSMGSSYNAIQLVTKIPGEVIGPQMAIVFAIAILSTGIAVLHMYNGIKGIKDGILPLVSSWILMSFLLWFMNYIGTAQLASLISAAGGCVLISFWAFLDKAKTSKINSKKYTPIKSKNADVMGFSVAASPYYTLIIISIILQLPPIKNALADFFWALDYPEMKTSMGYVAIAAKQYSKIKLFSHPAPILLFSTILGYFIYTNNGIPSSIMNSAVKKTLQKCIPTSVGITTMVMMALIMIDSGMTNLIARGVAGFLGNVYPLASPFIGTLGTFITGSNTNSNIMFGALQNETAILIGKNAVLLCAAQSVGGSLGVSMAPSTIMMGAANVGLNGREGEIMAKTMRYCLLSTFLVGVFVWIMS